MGRYYCVVNCHPERSAVNEVSRTQSKSLPRAKPRGPLLAEFHRHVSGNSPRARAKETLIKSGGSSVASVSSVVYAFRRMLNQSFPNEFSATFH
jgi:hypothetical protein